MVRKRSTSLRVHLRYIQRALLYFLLATVTCSFYLLKFIGEQPSTNESVANIKLDPHQTGGQNEQRKIVAKKEVHDKADVKQSGGKPSTIGRYRPPNKQELIPLKSKLDSKVTETNVLLEAFLAVSLRTANATPRALNPRPPKKKHPKQASCPPNRGNVPPSSKPYRWRPLPGRFLLAVCSVGRMSNQVKCLQKYMIFSALLNRTMVVFRHDFEALGYDYEWVLDRREADRCLGDGAIVSVEEYLRKKRQKQVQVRALCWRKNCYNLGPRCELLEASTDGLVKVKRCEAAGALQNPSLAKFLEVYGPLQDEVLTLGDGYIVESILGVRYDISLIQVKKNCTTILKPAREILEASERFVEERMAGSRFACVHLRREDFWEHCQRRSKKCWQSVGRLGECVAESLRQLRPLNLTAIFLATNGDRQEALYFKERIQSLLGGPLLNFASLEHEHVHGKWLEPIINRGWPTNGPLMAELSKAICAQSDVFWGSFSSSYTKDISRIRDGIQHSTCHDQVMCKGTDERLVPRFP